MSINLNRSIKRGIFEPSKFLMASDSFQSSKFDVIRNIESRDNFMITWSDDSNHQKLGSDKLLAAYYDYYSNSFQYSITNKSRSGMTASVSFNKISPEAGTLLYLFFVLSDYSMSSRLETIGFSRLV